MKQTRKQTFYIIASAVALLLATIVIVISLNTVKNAPEEPPEKEQQQQQQEEELKKEYLEGENGNEEAADITVNKGETDAPPEELYNNTFDGDTGYTKLTDHNTAKLNPEGTVYDERWAFTTWGTLACELSQKQTVSEKALEPLLSFRKDLEKVDSLTSQNILMNSENILKKLSRSLGDRMPPDARGILLTVCDEAEVGVAVG